MAERGRPPNAQAGARGTPVADFVSGQTGEAIADIRSALIDEAWFGRREAQPLTASQALGWERLSPPGATPEAEDAPLLDEAWEDQQAFETHRYREERRPRDDLDEPTLQASFEDVWGKSWREGPADNSPGHDHDDGMDR